MILEPPNYSSLTFCIKLICALGLNTIGFTGIDLETEAQSFKDSEREKIKLLGGNYLLVIMSTEKSGVSFLIGSSHHLGFTLKSYL